MQLLYGDLLPNTILSKVQRLQNRAAHIITGAFDYVHVRDIDIFNNLKWMNIIQRRDYFVAFSSRELFRI